MAPNGKIYLVVIIVPIQRLYYWVL